jgi:hypothetical protein
VWVSEDGRDWERIDSEAFAPIDGGETLMTDVASGPLGIIAVGGTVRGPAVWRSSDARVWDRIDLDDMGSIEKITYGGPGLVAIGSVDGSNTNHFAAWVSSDGVAWEHFVDLEDFAALDVGAVTAGGPGLVAVGTSYTISDGYWDRPRALVWVSEDGRDWDRLPDGSVPEADGAWVERVSGDEAGLVAVGARTWRSPDGYVWEAGGTLYTPDVNQNPLIDSGAMDGDRLVGVGMEWFDSGPPHRFWVAFWVSDDRGFTWHRVTRLESTARIGMIDTRNLPAFIASDVIRFGSGFVAVGHSGVYLEETVDELSGNYCGGPEAWGGSCRTDGAVWIGEWTGG